MMLSGASILRRGIVRNLRSVTEQLQPCGVDLSLGRVLAWTSPATTDFENSRRRAAQTSELPFSNRTKTVGLARGAYLVEFNETVRIPLDCAGHVFVRFSLWQSGVVLTAGIILCKNAKLGQIAIHGLEEKVAGSRGIYQHSASSVGRDGPGTPASDGEK